MSIDQPPFSRTWLPNPAGLGSRVIRRAVRKLDDRLSRSQNIQAFSDDPTCILRYAMTTSPRAVRLSDGWEIRTGDVVADIHCWNDRVSPMPKGGPDLIWAQKTSSGLKRSLRLLAGALVARPDLQHARACRARVGFVGLGGSNESVSRIIQRLGFEDVDEGASARTHMHDALENILVALLVWTHNPEALRRDKLIREHRPVWSSRARLLGLHGRSNPSRGTE